MATCFHRYVWKCGMQWMDGSIDGCMDSCILVLWICVSLVWLHGWSTQDTRRYTCFYDFLCVYLFGVLPVLNTHDVWVTSWDRCLGPCLCTIRKLDGTVPKVTLLWFTCPLDWLGFDPPYILVYSFDYRCVSPWQWFLWIQKKGTYLTCTDDHLHHKSPHVGPLDQQRFFLRYCRSTWHSLTPNAWRRKSFWHFATPQKLWNKCLKFGILVFTSILITPHSIVLLPFLFYKHF